MSIISDSSIVTSKQNRPLFLLLTAKNMIIFGGKNFGDKKCFSGIKKQISGTKKLFVPEIFPAKNNHNNYGI